MKARVLWQISVATTPEAEATLAAGLTEIFGAPAAVHFDALKDTTTVSVYLPSCPPDLASCRAAWRNRWCAWRRDGLPVGAGRLRMRKLPAENWAESWKRHFRPLEIGAALLLKPDWSRRKPRCGQAVVVLNPGLSFGTGHHATTGFCLRQLVALRQPSTRQSFLDMGTGSGLLAIAAAKLGYAPVHAFDYDPDAVRVAAANARRNRVAAKLRLWRGDVTELPVPARRRYDVVCANLATDLLLAEGGRIAARVRAGGTLVLAGILHQEFAQVRTAYENLGMQRQTSRREREWRSGSFLCPRPRGRG